MEKDKIELAKDEKCLVNNILLDNCMGMVDALRAQTDQEAANNVLRVIQAAIASQQLFFAASLEEEFELSPQVMAFIKPVLESSYEQMESIKEQLIKNGDPNGFTIASTMEILGNVIKKIPNPTLIATP